MGFYWTKYVFLVYFLLKKNSFIRINLSNLNSSVFEIAHNWDVDHCKRVRPFWEDAIHFLFLQRQNVYAWICMNYTSMKRRNVKVLQNMDQNIGESLILFNTIGVRQPIRPSKRQMSSIVVVRNDVKADKCHSLRCRDNTRLNFHSINIGIYLH